MQYKEDGDFNPEICILKVDPIYSKKYIYSIINKYNIGNINNISIYPYHKNYNKVVISFHHWFNVSLKKLINNNNNFKIIHDIYQGWFWKCIKNIQ